jgi:peptidyl-prolyl cis-trans isomerase D
VVRFFILLDGEERMLQNIRDNTQGTIAKVIIAAICIPFVAFGIESLFNTGGNNDVAEVNGEGISDVELRQAIMLQQRQIMSRMGDKIDPAFLQEDRLRGPALDALVNQKIMLLEAKANDIGISDAAINQMIVANKDFEVDGKFSAERFQELLRGAGFTAKMYKELLKSELVINQQAMGIAQSGFMTPKETRLAAGLLNQTRDIRYSILPIEQEKKQTTVDHAQIKAYYDQHADEFYRPEQVVAEYIELTAKQFYPDISDEDLKKEHDNLVANFKADEQRRISHILLKTKDRSEAEAISKLNELKARAEKGEAFADLAKQFSEDVGSKKTGGDLGFVTEGALPQPLADAAKLLAKGAVSVPVASDAGVHLLYLAEVVKSEAPAFDAEKEAIRLRLQQERSAKAFVSASEKLADASFNAPDLASVAKELGVEVKVSAPVVREAPATDGIFSNRKVIESLFSDEVLAQGLNSDLIEIESGVNAVVVRAKVHTPRELKPLEEVAADIREKLAVELAKVNLQKKADDLIVSAKSATDTANVNWQEAKAAKRSGANVPFEVLSAAFDVAAPPKGKRLLLSKALSNGDVAVIDVSNVADAAATDTLSAEMSSISRFLAQNDGREAYDAWQKYLTDSAEIKKN